MADRPSYAGNQGGTGIISSVDNAMNVGLVLLDSELRFISASQAALRVLAFPDTDIEPSSVDAVIAAKIDIGALGETTEPQQFQSGRRTYETHVIRLDRYYAEPNSLTALVLKRSGASGLDLDRLSYKFGLTRREVDTVRLLVQGSSTVEIAEAMMISPNTVKVFVRLIMAKMRVSNRAAIVAEALRSS